MGKENSTPALKVAGGWSSPDQGIISIAELEEWISAYFNTEENLSEFERRNNGDYSEVRHLDRSRGYVFAGSLQLDRDYERRMQETRRLYEKEEKGIKLCFVDFDKEVAGFSWEKF